MHSLFFLFTVYAVLPEVVISRIPDLYRAYYCGLHWPADEGWVWLWGNAILLPCESPHILNAISSDCCNVCVACVPDVPLGFSVCILSQQLGRPIKCYSNRVDLFIRCIKCRY